MDWCPECGSMARVDERRLERQDDSALAKEVLDVVCMQCEYEGEKRRTVPAVFERRPAETGRGVSEREPGHPLDR